MRCIEHVCERCVNTDEAGGGFQVCCNSFSTPFMMNSNTNSLSTSFDPGVHLLHFHPTPLFPSLPSVCN